MKPNTLSTLDLSTGHLSPDTRLWMETHGKDHGIHDLDAGFFLSSYAGSAYEDGEDVARWMPFDLLHVLRFAAANDASYVLFDRDAEMQPGLPVYDEDTGALLAVEDGGPERFIGDTGIVQDGPWVGMVDPSEISKSDLVLEQTSEVEITDGDFFLKDGSAWVGTATASIRVATLENGDVSVTVFGRGCEMNDPVAEAYAVLEDLQDAMESNRDADEPEFS